MSINFDSATTAAIEDPSRVAVQLLLNELRGSAFVWPLARDLSNEVFDGSLSVIIPRSKGFAVGNAPGGVGSATSATGNEFANVGRTYASDTLVINRFKAVHDYIYDLDQDKSRVDLRANFLMEAPGSLAEFLEADITESLYLGKSSIKTVTGSGTGAFVSGDLGSKSNYVRFSGTTNTLIEVSQLDAIAVSMSAVKVPKMDRILLASPKQARALAATAAIRDASQYGTNESILNGEVARISGFRIVESPFLAPGKAVAFQRDGIYKALLQDADVESSRQHKILADLLTITVKYGVQCPRDGGLIWAMGAETTHLLAAQAGILADQTSVTAGVPAGTNDPAKSEGSDLG